MIHGGEFENRIEHDFSVNVNPVKTPESVLAAMHKALECAEKYPQIHSDELVSALAKALGAEEKNVLVGNGSSELFLAVVNAFSPCKILIPVPSFYGYEYAACSKKNDVRVMKLENSEEYQVTIVCYFLPIRIIRRERKFRRSFLPIYWGTAKRRGLRLFWMNAFMNLPGKRTRCFIT